MRNEKPHFPMPGLACPISQLVAFPHEIRLFSVGLRSDGDVPTCSHRHGASYDPRDTRNPNVILSCGCGGNSHDQACGRDNVVDSPQDGCSHPTKSIGKVVLRMLAKTAHFFSPDATSSPKKCSGAYKEASSAHVRLIAQANDPIRALQELSTH
jgi:hypothetical protein